MSASEFASFPLRDMELRTAEDDGRHYIEGIAVPWGVRTDRVGTPELFERGAFRELVASNGKVKLTDYNHSKNRVPVGFSTLIEDRTEGLWMRFRLNHTPEGKSALENTADGVYGGLSIGFVPRQEETRGGVRHVKSAWLDHVSLVEEPAYEDARITEVRAALDKELSEWRALAAIKIPLDTRSVKSQTLLMAEIRHRMNRA